MKKELDCVISPKMQLLCLQIFEYIESHPDPNLSDIYREFKWCPKPVVHLAIRLLNHRELATITTTHRFKTPQIDAKRLLEKIQSTTLHPASAICERFKLESLRTPYICNNSSIFYQELSCREYLRFKEFYDYQTHTLKPDSGYGYFARQFGALIADETGTKRSHIFVACTPDGSIIGYVSIANLSNYDGKATKTDIPNENIYNINFITTRPGFENLGIATNLLTYAINHVQDSEDLRLLLYDPICEQSKRVMLKVFENKNYEVISLDLLPKKDMFKFGYFIGYAIIPKENTKSTELEAE